MAIIKDGNQAFGLAQQAINQRKNEPSFDMPLEAINFTQTSTRVDLNNGNGEPIGSVTVQNREEFSATVKVPKVSGIPSALLYVGNIYTVNGKKVILTEVAFQEASSDYQTFAISGYVRTNASHTIYPYTIVNTWVIQPNVKIEVQSTGKELPFNRKNPFTPNSDFNVNPVSTPVDYYGHFDNPDESVVVELPISVYASVPFDASGSELSNGVSFVTACCSNTFIKLIISSTATEVNVGLRFST